MTPHDLDEVRVKAEFDRLMTAANVNRRRGDYGKAAEAVSQALKLRPSDLEAREFAADILSARGELEKAADVYRSILEEDGSRASAEEKFARVTLQMAEAKRQRELLQDMLENPARRRVEARNPILAALLSGVPGLGHVYCGDMVRGVALFIGASLSWLIFFALRPVVSFYPPDQRITMFVKNLSTPAVIFLCLALILHAYAVVNSAVMAEKTKTGSGSAL